MLLEIQLNMLLFELLLVQGDMDGHAILGLVVVLNVPRPSRCNFKHG